MVEEFYQCKPSCQGAVGYGCVCDCCGQTHGVATVAYVLGLSSAAMVRISEEVNTARGKIPSTPSSHPTQDEFGNVVTVFRLGDMKANLSALNLSSSQQSMANQIVQNLQSQVITQALNTLFTDQPREKTHSSTQHLLCDVTASIAVVCQSPQKVLASAQKKTAAVIANLVVSQVLTSRDKRRGNDYRSDTERYKPAMTEYVSVDPNSSLPEKALKTCGKTIVLELLKDIPLPIAGQLAELKELSTVFQIISVLICPAPQKHPLVWNECLKPLALSLANPSTRTLLTQPDTWD